MHKFKALLLACALLLLPASALADTPVTLSNGDFNQIGIADGLPPVSYTHLDVYKRQPRDGAFVEELGYYNPIAEPAELKVDNEKAVNWMKNGAQPTDTVRALLKKSGAIQ